MSDLSSDFDARRIGWWARRSAVRRIRRSTALTEADRELRVQQARAAQTRGEVSALTRGLSVTAVAPPQWTPPNRPTAGTPSPPSPPSPPGRPPAYAPPPPQQPSSAPSAQRVPVPQPFVQQPPARKTSIRRHLVIGLVILLLLCGGGLVSCVSAVVDSVQDASSSSSTTPVSAPDPQTEDGWNEMIHAFDDEADLSKAVGLVARRRSATLSVEAGGAEASRYYFDGDVTPASEVGRGPTEQLFDLADIDGAVVAEAVARARRASGYPESDEAWVQVWAGASGPRIAVTFPTAGAGAYALVVDALGLTVSETS